MFHGGLYYRIVESTMQFSQKDQIFNTTPRENIKVDIFHFS